VAPRTGRTFVTVCLNPTIQRTLLLDRLLQGEVNRVRELSIDASGKGINVSRVLAQLGRTVTHLTQAGGRDGALFLELARGDGVPVVAIDTAADVRTATTLLDRGAANTTEIVEEGRAVEPGVEDRIRAAFSALLGSSPTVVISGTKAPGFSRELFPWMVAEARGRGCPVVLDYRGDDLLASLPCGPNVIKPNLAEFASTFLPGERISEGAENRELLARVKARMLLLSEEQGIATVLTRGRYATLYVDGGRVLEAEPQPVAVLNTTGSGDSFAAGLAAALSDGADIASAVALGHDCAARNAALLRPGVIR
jgi:1-phosphofructokinase family hexose kinase